MKLTTIKAMVGKVMAIGLLAGAVASVAPAKAQAQGFAIGVQFGSSGYYQGDGRSPYWERERYLRAEREREEIARQQAWAQHEAWERHERHEQHERWEHVREFDRGYDRGYGANGYDAGQRGGYYGR